MKPISLSMRLSLSVALTGAALVISLASLAYIALTHQLELLARQNLDSKLEQIQHDLSVGMTLDKVANSPHVLLDSVTGHDNLNLTIFIAKSNASHLLSIGREDFDPQLSRINVKEVKTYHAWTNRSGNKMLTVSIAMPLADGNTVRVLLSSNRVADQALLSAYIKVAIITVPLLLIFTGVGAFWIVRRGLSPLRKFRQTAALTSTQDLSHRIPVDNLPTELSKLADSINIMFNRLDNGVQQLTQFSDDLAHELRTPITNLMGKAQVTLSKTRTTEAYKATLESCTEELGRISRIVTDMLFLANVTQPAALLDLETVDLNYQTGLLVELFSFSAEEKQIDLRITGNGSAYGDRLMIQRAISNLLSNAIRHSPVGSQIDISISAENENTLLTVYNPGPGIPEQHITHLFKRFYRVDPDRSRVLGGKGLGLAIVSSIMQLHGGTVGVSSEVNGLTQFSLIFPPQTAAQHNLAHT
ncbi:heavy metal sensor histidine kinase [Pseudomonas sp. M30-35]|uniref:heavy metal sensor histidine kinase n=1 Tax=Pseudomonas sp. M30-35 TaxID=1981174 RepID=UPI000B3C3848|nr:heavy metal sensor histidine kinase [Pseudomonas sp. M30-35]ARU87493.1 two-component sensor histidine kinase [Pseudomonas sp. M30-35]